MPSQKKLKEQKSNTQDIIFKIGSDPSHEKGHKKMNLKSEFSKATANKTRSKKLSEIESVTRAESIRRKERPQRRLTNPAD